MADTTDTTDPRGLDAIAEEALDVDAAFADALPQDLHLRGAVVAFRVHAASGGGGASSELDGVERGGQVATDVRILSDLSRVRAAGSSTRGTRRAAPGSGARRTRAGTRSR